MSFTAIVSGIFAIAKAVPTVAKYIDQFVDMYTTNQLQKIENEIVTRKQKRSALMRAISKAETNAERKALSKVLHNLVIGGKL
jgi:hypothetical protein